MHDHESFLQVLLRELATLLDSSRQELSDGTLFTFQLPREPRVYMSPTLHVVRGDVVPQTGPYFMLEVPVAPPRHFF